MAWPRRRRDMKCEATGRSYRDELGKPVVPRCQEWSEEAVKDQKDRPMYMCLEHAEMYWHKGLVTRNPRLFDNDNLVPLD